MFSSNTGSNIAIKHTQTKCLLGPVATNAMIETAEYCYVAVPVLCVRIRKCPLFFMLVLSAYRGFHENRKDPFTSLFKSTLNFTGFEGI